MAVHRPGVWLYVRLMFRPWLHRLTLALAALVVAVASVQGAARMAPAAIEDAQVALWLAQGIGVDDVCGQVGTQGEHRHCPFCHKLGEAPVARIAPRELRLVFSQVTARGVGQPVAPQHGGEDNLARAPPRAV